MINGWVLRIYLNNEKYNQEFEKSGKLRKCDYGYLYFEDVYFDLREAEKQKAYYENLNYVQKVELSELFENEIEL